jgi:hypothetical protein
MDNNIRKEYFIDYGILVKLNEEIKLKYYKAL